MTQDDITGSLVVARQIVADIQAEIGAGSPYRLWMMERLNDLCEEILKLAAFAREAADDE